MSGAIDLPTTRFTIPYRSPSIRDQNHIEDDILLLIITNTSSVGGFRNVAPLAGTGDGMLDVLVSTARVFSMPFRFSSSWSTATT